MITSEQRAYINAYTKIGCVDVVAAMVASGTNSTALREMCNSPDFVRELHSVFASMEGQPPADPFDFAPHPPITLSWRKFGIDLPDSSYDFCGPTYNGNAYDHGTRAFIGGTKMSEVVPSAVTWFSYKDDWKSIDRQVAAAAG